MALPCDIFIRDNQMGRDEHSHFAHCRKEIEALRKMLRELTREHGCRRVDACYDDWFSYSHIERRLMMVYFPRCFMKEILSEIPRQNRTLIQDIEFLRRVEMWFMKDREE
jgi:hypothetical protein